MDTNWQAPDRPMSITEISEQANKFVYNDSIPLKNWTRAAASLIKQVRFFLMPPNSLDAVYLLVDIAFR